MNIIQNKQRKREGHSHNLTKSRKKGSAALRLKKRKRFSERGSLSFANSIRNKLYLFS